MKSIHQPSRRQFIKTVALGTAVSSLMGEDWVGTVLADIEPASAVGILRLNLSDYPALQNIPGAIRISVNPIVGTFPNGTFYPILVNRASATQFYALNSQCTHQQCVVGTYIPSVGFSTCPCHFSTFGIDGARRSGEATQPLSRYNLTYDGANLLKIEVPGLGYSVTSSRVVNPATRLALSFPSLLNVRYEVRFRETINQAWTVIPFATTAGGSLTSTELIGNNQTRTVYVERTTSTGFYSIAVKVLNV